MGGTIIKINLAMYKSLASALLVAATQAATYKIDGTTVKGAKVGVITASTCEIVMTSAVDPAKATTAAFTLSTTASQTLLTNNDDSFETACSIQEATAKWVIYVASVATESGGKLKAGFKDVLASVTTAPALVASKLLTDYTSQKWTKIAE